MLKKLSIPGFLLAASMLFVSAPSNKVAASSCGAGDGQLCTSNQSCINILFYSQCTTKNSYYFLI